MSAAPEWVVRVVVSVGAIVCIAFVVFSEPVYRRIKNPSLFPYASTAWMALIMAAIAGTTWWSYVAQPSLVAAERQGKELAQQAEERKTQQVHEKRRQFRNELGQLLGSAQILRETISSQATMAPDHPLKKEVRQQWSYFMQLHMEASNVVGSGLNDEAEMIRIMSSEHATHYPKGIEQATPMGNFWDKVVSLIKRLEELLDKYPPL